MIAERTLFKKLLATVSASALFSVSSAVANPLDPTVQSGDVTFEGLGSSNVVIGNNSERAVVDWDSFSIGAGEVTTINQISNDAAILNRVTGGNVSEIYGTLESNGQVYLINESGILVGAEGVVDTNGFVASTLDVSNAEFLAGGDMVFKQGIDVGGGIEVHGKIRSVSGGDIFLLSREITIHEGAEVTSNGGYVGLGAGEEILLRPTDSGDGRISIRAGKGKIKQSGTVEAAVVELRAAGGNEYALAINNTGVIRATRAVKTRGGRVLLAGGGTVKNSGKVYAKRKVVVRSKKKIVNAGSIKIPQSKPSEAEIIMEAPDIVVEAGSVLDVSAALGGGRIAIGGGFQGSKTYSDGTSVDISENASTVTIEKGAQILADATENGDGGEVIVWADGATSFAGEVSAKGVGDGDGGFVEVSGKGVLAYAGLVDLRAENGNSGTLLLDPVSITVTTGAGADDGNIADGVLNDADNFGVSTIEDGVIEAQLATSDVVLTASGLISFASGVRIEWVAPTLLDVQAGGAITAADNVIIQNTQQYVDLGSAGFDAGDTFVQEGVGGVRFNAGAAITIGGGVAGVMTGDVAIGSEFGINEFDATGAITVAGGSGHSAQIGYRVDAKRANNTGLDYINVDGDRAANGNIVVDADGLVAVTAGDPTGIAGASFAQIGHGGEAPGKSVAAISGNISVTAGGVVNVEGAPTVLAKTKSSPDQFAKIGHGSLLETSTGEQLVQGDISGNILVEAKAGAVTVNSMPLAPTAITLGREVQRAQIGHGGTGIVRGGDTYDGVEYVHGRIQGNIDVRATAGVIVGTTLVDSTTNLLDTHSVLSQIGHGAHGYHVVGGLDVSGVIPSTKEVYYAATTNSQEDGDPTTDDALRKRVFATDADGNFVDENGNIVVWVDADGKYYDDAGKTNEITGTQVLAAALVEIDPDKSAGLSFVENAGTDDEATSLITIEDANGKAIKFVNHAADPENDAPVYYLKGTTTNADLAVDRDVLVVISDQEDGNGDPLKDGNGNVLKVVSIIDKGGEQLTGSDTVTLGGTITADYDHDEDPDTAAQQVTLTIFEDVNGNKVYVDNTSTTAGDGAPTVYSDVQLSNIDNAGSETPGADVIINFDDDGNPIYADKGGEAATPTSFGTSDVTLVLDKDGNKYLFTKSGHLMNADAGAKVTVDGNSGSLVDSGALVDPTTVLESVSTNSGSVAVANTYGGNKILSGEMVEADLSGLNPFTVAVTGDGSVTFQYGDIAPFVDVAGSVLDTDIIIAAPQNSVTYSGAALDGGQTSVAYAVTKTSDVEGNDVYLDDDGNVAKDSKIDDSSAAADGSGYKVTYDADGQIVYLDNASTTATATLAGADTGQGRIVTVAIDVKGERVYLDNDGKLVDPSLVIDQKLATNYAAADGDVTSSNGFIVGYNSNKEAVLLDSGTYATHNPGALSGNDVSLSTEVTAFKDLSGSTVYVDDSGKIVDVKFVDDPEQAAKGDANYLVKYADPGTTAVYYDADSEGRPAGAVVLNAISSVESGALFSNDVVDNFQRAQIGHGSMTQAGTFLAVPVNVSTTGGELDVVVKEGRIAGDIELNTIALAMTSSVISHPQRPAQTFDYMLTRVGHASGNFLTSADGGATYDGGAVSITQSHILDANIDINAAGMAISTIITTPAQTGLMTGNTAVAQIGHSGDVLVKTGAGGAGSTGNDAGNGGDFSLVKGSVWDGGVWNGTIGDPENSGYQQYVGLDSGFYGEVDDTNIRITSAGVLAQTATDTVGAQAASTSNVVLNSIGHGHRILVTTGDGGAAGVGHSGGRGGDFLITQGKDNRTFSHLALELNSANADEINDDIGKVAGINTDSYDRVWRRRILETQLNGADVPARTVGNVTTDITLIGTVNPATGETYRYFQDSDTNPRYTNGSGGILDDSVGNAVTDPDSIYYVELYEGGFDAIRADLNPGDATNEDREYFRHIVEIDKDVLVDGQTVAQRATSDIAQIGVVGEVDGYGDIYRFFVDHEGNHYQVELVDISEDPNRGEIPESYRFAFENEAQGLRGDIEIDTALVSLLSNVTTGAQAVGDSEAAFVNLGHGDYAEVYSGNGGAGGTADGAADAAQVEAHGGRGGHIDMNLSDMLIEGDIVFAPEVAGAITVNATIVNPVQGTLNFSISEANLGHGSRMFAHSGNGGAGGSNNYLANLDAYSVTDEETEERFLTQFGSDESGSGAARGGNGGDIRIAFGAITDRVILDRHNSDTGIAHDDEADIVLKSVAATTVTALHTPGYQATANSHDIYAGIGHSHRFYGEGGFGANGGTSLNEFDGNGNDSTENGDVFIQPNVSGGRGGDVLLSSGNIIGDIVIDGGPVAVTVPPTAGSGGFQKVIAHIGHTTDLIAVTQYGGSGGTLGGSMAGAIVELELQATNGTNSISEIFLHDGDGDDAFKTQSTVSKDGVDIAFKDYNGGERDGQAETFSTLERYLGSNPTSSDRDGVGTGTYNSQALNDTGDTGIDSSIITGDHNGHNIAPGQSDDVIIHDTEGDPEYILVTALSDNPSQADGEVNSAGHVIGTFVRNYDGNDGLGGTPYKTLLDEYRGHGDNVGRYGRTVSEYGHRNDTDGVGFATIGNKFAFAQYVDLDQDGDVDLVDFDLDGQFDVVDVDKDGYYDKIDGRADYVSGSGVTHGILDYTAVSGQNYDAGHTEGGWTLFNTLSSDNKLADDYGNITAAGTDGSLSSTHRYGNVNTNLVGDFSNANGGRGGDAFVHAGFTQGDVVIDAAGVIAVTSGTTEEPIEHAPALFDLAQAQIGHGGYHWADTSANYAARSSGRMELTVMKTHIPKTDLGHLAANGGSAGAGALNASGGRAGDAWVLEGNARDIDASHSLTAGEATHYEDDYLVGSIVLNAPDYDKEGNDTSNPNHSSYSQLDPTTYDSDDESWERFKSGKKNDDGQIYNKDSYADYVKDRVHFTTLDAHDADGLRTGVVHADDVSGAVTVTSLGAITGTSTTVISKIGHGGTSHATSGNWIANITDMRYQMGVLFTNKGGNGGSDVDVTEIANGGRGGDGSVESLTMKGETRIDTKAALTVSSGLTAAPRMVSGFDTVIAQIGHGGIQLATGGGDIAATGNGGTGELMSNGGRGGDVNIKTSGTLDSEVNLNVTGLVTVTALHAPGVSTTGINNIISANIGHGDWSFAEGGHGGSGGGGATAPQLNSAANGGRGGDVVIKQGGYNGDINIDTVGGILVTSAETPGLSAIVPNQYLIAGIGHGGQAIGLSNAGGSGGSDIVALSADRNLTTIVDFDNQITLAGDRNGGRGGHADVQVSYNGTGRVTGDRTVNTNYYGVTDNDGSDIHIFTKGVVNVLSTVAQANAEVPDILADPLGAPLRTIDATTAIIGHHGQARANAVMAKGGSASDLSASEVNGGDGGDARAVTGFVQGDIVIDSAGIVNVGSPTGDTATLPGGALFNKIVEARVGHNMQAEALGGSGGASTGTGSLSARGGDSGTALVDQDRIWGDITVRAGGVLTVMASDANPLPASSPTIITAIGHHMDGKAIAGLLAGANGKIDTTNNEQTLYFTYEALLEFKERWETASSNSSEEPLEVAFDGLSEFEQKLVAPFYSSDAYKANVDDKSAYFDDKNISQFLEHLPVGQRDDNNVEDSGAIGYEYAAFDGNDHQNGPHDNAGSNGSNAVGDGFNNVQDSTYNTYLDDQEADNGQDYEVLDPDADNDHTNRTDDRVYLSDYDKNVSTTGNHADQTLDGADNDDTGRDFDNVSYELDDGNGGNSRKLVGNQVNNRSTRYEIGALTEDEVATIVALISQSGDGGHAAVIQGGYGAGEVEASGPAFIENQDLNYGTGVDNVNRSVGGNIHLEAPAMIVTAMANGVAIVDPTGFQATYVGHQAEVLQVKAGDSASSLHRGISGDGGDAGIVQSAFEGDIVLEADSVLVTSTYTGAASLKNQLTVVGHRLNVGHDYVSLRPGAGLEGVAYVVRAGDAGDAASGAYAGNGGTAAVYQHGVISNWNDHDGDGIPDSADVDILNNGDHDGDGIDDIADVTYNTGTYIAGDARYGDSAGDSVGARGVAGSDGIKDSFNDTDGHFNDHDNDGIEDSADVDLIGGGDVDGDGVSDYADVRFDFDTLDDQNQFNTGSNDGTVGGSDDAGGNRNAYIDESRRMTRGGDGIVDAYNDTDGVFDDIDGDGIEDSADYDVLKNGDHDLDGIDDIADVDFRGYTHNDREAGQSDGVETNDDTMLVLQLRRWSDDEADADNNAATGLFDNDGEQVSEWVTGDINVSGITGAVMDRDETNNNVITGTIASLGATEQASGTEDVEILNLDSVADDDEAFQVIYDGTTGKFYAAEKDTVTLSDGTTKTYTVRGAEYADSRIIDELTKYEMVVVGDAVSDADQTNAMTVAFNSETGIVLGDGTAQTNIGHDLNDYNTNRGRWEITNIDARHDNNIVDRYEITMSDRDGDAAIGVGVNGDGNRLWMVDDNVTDHSDTGTVQVDIPSNLNGADVANGTASVRNAQYDVANNGWVGLLVDSADANFRVNGDSDANGNADNIDDVADIDFVGTVNTAEVADRYNGQSGILAAYEAGSRANGARPIRNNIVIRGEGATGTVTINSNSTTGLGINETETHVGHEMVVVSVKSGDGGNADGAGLSEGVREGNGGDVSISQGDLGGDLNLYGENLVTINSVAITGIGMNYTQTHIGHQRVVGEDSDRQNDLIPVNSIYEGSIIAGIGGYVAAEDYNGTSKFEPAVDEQFALTEARKSLGSSSRYGSITSHDKAVSRVEDADGGVVEIIHGVLKGADNVSNREAIVASRMGVTVGSDGSFDKELTGFEDDIAISLDSHGDVLINTTGTLAGLGIANSRLTIGFEQSAVAQAGNADVRSTGDGGDVFINRDAISGDIVAQALDNGKVVVANLPTAGLAAAFADLHIGHDSNFGHELETVHANGTTSSITAGNSGSGEDRYGTIRDDLVAFLKYDSSTTLQDDETITNLQGENEYRRNRVTIVEAGKAVDVIENAERVLNDALQNLKDRYAPEDLARLQAAQSAVETARVAAEAALNSDTNTDDQAIDIIQVSARTALNAIAYMSDTASDADTDISSTTYTQAELDQIFEVSNFTEDRNDAYTALENLLNGIDRDAAGNIENTDAFAEEDASKQIADRGVGGSVIYTLGATKGHVLGDIVLVAGQDNESAHFNTTIDPNAPSGAIQNLFGDLDSLEAQHTGSSDAYLRADVTTDPHIKRGDGLLGIHDDYDDDDQDGDVDTGTVSVTSIATSAAGAAVANTDVGHRRSMVNNSGNGAGVAGNGGAIVVANYTAGDITFKAFNTVVESDAVVPIGATLSALRILHEDDMMNNAGHAGTGNLLGDGGDIYSIDKGSDVDDSSDDTYYYTQKVEGGFNLITDSLGSDQTFGAGLTGTGGSAQFHVGHAVTGIHTAQAEAGQSHENRGGDVAVTQVVAGDRNGDLVTFNMDIDEDGKARDLHIRTYSAFAGAFDTRIGNDVQQEAASGTTVVVADSEMLIDSRNVLTTAESGNVVVAEQLVEGDIEFNVEDLKVSSEATLAANADVYVGHDAVNSAVSGNAIDDEIGAWVVAKQTIKGAVDLQGLRTFTLETINPTNLGEAHVGHSGTQTALSGDDDLDDNLEENPAPGRRITDITATQLIESDLSVSAGEILVASDTLGRTQLGHEAFHILTGNALSHMEATSDVNPNTDFVLTTVDPTSLAAATDTTLNTTPNGDLNIGADLAAGEAQIGHRSTSKVNAGGSDSTATADTRQSIGDSNGGAGDIRLTVFNDMSVETGIAGSTAQLGHFITEEGSINAAEETSIDGQTLKTTIDQVLNVDILGGDTETAGVEGAGESIGNNLQVVAAASSRAMIGHMSPGTNVGATQDGDTVLTNQRLSGDITLEVGSDDDEDVADGNASSGDDIQIVAAAGGVARVGHNHNDSEGARNRVQVSQGDIWLEAGADILIDGGAVGHEHYVTDSKDLSSSNSVNHEGNTVRDRILGNTTIGAAQNTPEQDSTDVADVLKIVGTTNPVVINSGYGDSDGQLRFFIPAQENLTIEGADNVIFNDSAASGDITYDRTADAGNVFSNEGGNDHEHDFTLMSDTAQYSAAKVGDGNFGFYFEQTPASGGGEVHVPFVPPAFSGALDIVFDSRTGTYGVVNIGSLEGNVVVGTSSFEALCEESGMTNCGQIGQRFANSGVGRSGASGVNGYGSGFGSLFVGYYFDEETGEWRRIEEPEGEQEEQANGPVQPSTQVAAAQPNGRVRILTARSVRLEQTIVNAGVVQEEDIVVNNSSPRRPVVIGSNVEQPAPRGTVRIQSTASERTAVGSNDSGLVSQQVDAQISVEAGYGQMVSNRFDQKAFLRQLGYQSAMSSTSSYGLFSTGGS